MHSLFEDLNETRHVARLTEVWETSFVSGAASGKSRVERCGHQGPEEWPIEFRFTDYIVPIGVFLISLTVKSVISLRDFTRFHTIHQ